MTGVFPFQPFLSDDAAQFDLRRNEHGQTLLTLNSFLKRLAADVDWEAFRPALSVLRKPQPKGGRPPFDVILMFKIIVIKSQYNLSDDITE
ncbi:hypothetical protein FACS1894189_0510 [Planctomycetales bacterium]|nr:hypothetical protein FACS1894189_0510 [Planctomycetales bacterium]